MKYIKCALMIIEKHLGSILIAAAILAAALIYAYYNPYQSCKRDLRNDFNSRNAAYTCSGIN